jgi:hypothetical protein
MKTTRMASDKPLLLFDREPAVLIGKPAAGTRATRYLGADCARRVAAEAIWAILPPAITMGVKPPDANTRGVNLET